MEGDGELRVLTQRHHSSVQGLREGTTVNECIDSTHACICTCWYFGVVRLKF